MACPRKPLNIQCGCMDVLARDLTLTDASLRRVFDNVKAAQLLPSDATFDRARFVDETYLQASRN